MTARYNWVESAKLLLEREDLNENNLRENGQNIHDSATRRTLASRAERELRWRETTLGYRRL